MSCVLGLKLLMLCQNSSQVYLIFFSLQFGFALVLQVCWVMQQVYDASGLDYVEPSVMVIVLIPFKIVFSIHYPLG